MLALHLGHEQPFAGLIVQVSAAASVAVARATSPEAAQQRRELAAAKQLRLATGAGWDSDVEIENYGHEREMEARISTDGPPMSRIKQSRFTNEYVGTGSMQHEWSMLRLWGHEDEGHQTFKVLLSPHKCECTRRWQASAICDNDGPLVQARKRLKLPVLVEEEHIGYSKQWHQKYGLRLCSECLGVRQISPHYRDAHTRKCQGQQSAK